MDNQPTRSAFRAFLKAVFYFGGMAFLTVMLFREVVFRLFNLHTFWSVPLAVLAALLGLVIIGRIVFALCIDVVRTWPSGDE